MALRQTGIQLLVDCFLLRWRRPIAGPTSSQLMIFDQSGPKVNAQVLLQRPQLHQCLDNFHLNVSSIFILVVCNLRRWKSAQLQSYTSAGCIFPKFSNARLVSHLKPVAKQLFLLLHPSSHSTSFRLCGQRDQQQQSPDA